MKYAYFFVFILIISCGKKEEKKDSLDISKPDVTTIEPKSIVDEVPELIFTVQIAALKKENSTLANIDSVKTYKENGLTKFRFGEFSTYNEARKTRSLFLNKYPGAFVQAIKNGEPIHIKEALLK